MARRLKYIVLFIGLLTKTILLSAGGNDQMLTGKVVNKSGDPVPFATLYIPQLEKGTAADHSGYFKLKGIQETGLTLEIESVGYQDLTVEITQELLSNDNLTFTLIQSDIQIDKVLVTAKTEEFKAREKAYSVAALDAAKFKNSNLDVSNMLAKVSGVNIREKGGLGSDFTFSINGLSGKQVKFFIDGVPMENYGSSFNINNIPVNLIDHIEVYKGVVPVWLGRDALGGAVNIITRDNIKDYLDISYSIGSFNTHKAAVNGKYEFGESGFIVKTSAYYNYSDNNYEVNDLEKHDELGNVVGSMSAERFHDSYESAMLQVKAGIENKSYADKLLLGITLSGNHDNVQHGMSLERVFGQVHTKDKLIMPTIEYEKNDLFVKGLDINLYSSYIDGEYKVVDTSSREYNWDGSYTYRSNPNIGESDWQKTLFSFNDRTFLGVGNVKYSRNNNEFALNVTSSRFVRTGSDPLDPDIVPFSDPNFLNKNILGMSYTRSLFEDRLSVTPFVKYFIFNGKTIEEDVYSENPRKIIHRSQFREPGYGLAATFDLLSNLKIKTSFENTFRLPEGSEIFGDGLNVLSNPQLKPEHSENFNAGIFYHKVSSLTNWIFEANFFYRNAESLIRQVADGAKSEHENLANALVKGGETELTFRWNNQFSATLNATYQHLLNTTKYDENGNYNYTYMDRLPNIPYLFGNLNLNYSLKKLFTQKDALDINLNTRYVHEFYLKWPSHGGDKHIIPRQLVHSISLNYAFNNGKYNISLGSSNLTDKKVYDNFRVQKPGRAFYLKLRYFVN